MDLYKKYYLEKQDWLDIINTGIIVFDTSALLDFYYYSDEAQTQLFSNAFVGLKDRLWIPAQCYFEFLKNKGKVAAKPRMSYESLLDNKNKDRGYVSRIAAFARNFGKDEIVELKGQLQTLKETTKKNDKHPYLNQDLFEPFEQALTELEEHIGMFKEAAKQFESNIINEIHAKIDKLHCDTDDIQQFIEANFEIGEEFSYEHMAEICEEGRVRYSEKIPPGYEDGKEKKGMQKYGDLFAWKQILEMATERKKDVFLIIHDTKVDWWSKEQNAPCFELLKEFNSTTGKRFWSSSMKDFLYLLNECGDETNKISEEIIEEVDDAIKQMIEDSLKIEIDNLYSAVLLNWIDSDTDYILGNRHDIHSEWRVFGKCYLYDAVNYMGDEALVLMHIAEKINYANVYHAFNNLLEIKRYFDRLGKEFKYRQVVVTKTPEVAEKLYNQVRKNKKLNKIFYRGDIENDLGYMSEGKFIYMYSNHPMG